MASIGSWIARHRQRLGLSQGQLAERVGLGQQAVSAWERHKTEPADDVLRRLADLFGDAAPERRHLRPLDSISEDEVSDIVSVFTRERFALEVLEPRIQSGPLSDAEVALLRDVARSVYGIDLGNAVSSDTRAVAPTIEPAERSPDTAAR